MESVNENSLDCKGLSSSRNAWKITILVVLSGGMVLSHYLTPTMSQHAVLHDIYRRVLYIPVILAAFWYGGRGGLLCAFLIGAAYFPHIFHDWGGGILKANLNRTLEALMYLIIGGMTGALVDRLRSANASLKSQSTALREAMDGLTHKTREIFEAEEQLRQADRMTTLGQLATGLAHEIRNPLGSIRGAAEIIGDKDISQDQREEFTHVLIEEADRLDHVLTNFLEYARTQRDGKDPEATQVYPIVVHLIKLLEQRMNSVGIEVHVDGLENGLPDVAMGKGLLQQVLLNLMINAIQAMSEGGAMQIEAGLNLESNRLRIAVTDTGGGIPEAMRVQVFDPFFTTKTSGTGLGLSIVKKIVLEHKGEISIDDHYHHGTRMVVELPTT